MVVSHSILVLSLSDPKKSFAAQNRRGKYGRLYHGNDIKYRSTCHDILEHGQHDCGHPHIVLVLAAENELDRYVKCMQGMCRRVLAS